MNLPSHVTRCANQVLDAIRALSGKNILPGLDGAMLLNERAALMQLQATSHISANGSCHLLLTNDNQWIALNLSRRSDWELLPALFKQFSAITTWEHVSALVKKSSAAGLIEQGHALGLPIALAQQELVQQEFLPGSSSWFKITCKNDACNRNKKTAANKQPLVLDLSSLWAGPLCSRLLQLTGARVIKVESTQRPDGMRLNTEKGGKEFFELLNKNKELVTLDFNSTAGIDELKKLIGQADIVIEGSRPRALRQLGINAEEIIQQHPGFIWISITGYGRNEPQANWVAFGDDAAISAGLFHFTNNKPTFIGDAIADPLTGLHAALAALQFWQQGKSVLLDINLQTVAKHCSIRSTEK